MNDTNYENFEKRNVTEPVDNDNSKKLDLNGFQTSKSDNSSELKAALEDSFGQLKRSLCYLDPNESAISPKVLFPEEAEYNDLDKSIENLDDASVTQNKDEKPSEDALTTPVVTNKKKRPPKLNVSDINPRNKDLLRLGLRQSCNCPNTPVVRYGTSSNYSDADSGIGTTTPTKRISEMTGVNNVPWVRMNSDVYDDILGSQRINRNTLTVRSNRSYNFDNENSYTRNTSSLKSNRSFDIENFFLNRLSPTSEFRNFDVASLRSLTIPMGSSDGRKIIKRSETSPEELLSLNIK